MTVRINTAGLMLFAVLSSGCIKEERQVSFQHDVQPILKGKCIECHNPSQGKGYLETGLSMATYEDLMQGTFYGPVIVAGDSRHSILNMLVEGRADASMRMPHGRKALGSEEIEIFRLWVEHGALNN
ncbi:MAG: c-type cytochrome domain-containing protein [Pseudomonadota bacterium]|nr:c-type cytochrome domain-containing protein [Pseudomonadota bacterium]